jgi:hypothetical protein
MNPLLQKYIQRFRRGRKYSHHTANRIGGSAPRHLIQPVKNKHLAKKLGNSFFAHKFGPYSHQIFQPVKNNISSAKSALDFLHSRYMSWFKSFFVFL